MPLWIIFILVSFLLGLSISYLLDYPFQSIERVFFSIVVGHACSIWLIFLLSCLIGSLRMSLILLCVALCASLAVILLFGMAKKSGKPFFADFKNEMVTVWHEDRATLSFLVFMLLYVVGMNVYGVFRPDNAGNLSAFHTVWADYPFHTSLITSFVYRDAFTFPLDNPQFLHVKTQYPILMDFYSAVLLKIGVDLRRSIIIPNIIFQLSFFALLYFLALKLTGIKGAGIGATLIFILSGFPPGLQSLDIHFLNPLYAVILPQRTAIIGMAISFVVYLLLFDALCADKEKQGKMSASGGAGTQKELMLAGMLIGLLPYIHAHSFIATGFVAVCLASFSAIKRSDWKILAFWVLPILLLSLPQLLWIRTGVSEEFFVFFPGWAETNRDLLMGLDWSSFAAFPASLVQAASRIETFWALNAGALIILLSLGFFKARNETRIFYLPFLLLFVIANLVKFQPWYFDNYKLFIHWLALSAILASLALWWLLDVRNRSAKSLAAVSLALLLILCTFFGFVTHLSMIQTTSVVWSGAELELAEWVREHTAPDSIFLTGSAHNHPIPSLAGRQRVMGYEGWIWSHGINWTSISERKSDEIAMYNGNYTLMQGYGVDYICIGPYEQAFARDNHFTINYAAFEDGSRFNLTYDKMIAGERWRIYHVRKSESSA
jgi:hypothetical protein